MHKQESDKLNSQSKQAVNPWDNLSETEKKTIKNECERNKSILVNYYGELSKGHPVHEFAEQILEKILLHSKIKVVS